MKKLVSLIMVLALVLGLAIAVSATGTGESANDPIVITDVENLGTTELANGTIVWYQFPAEYNGYTLTVTAPMCRPGIFVMGWWGEEQVGGGFNEATYVLNAMYDNLIVGICDVSGYTCTATMTLTEPLPGSASKPVPVEEMSENAEEPTALKVTCLDTPNGPLYYMTWTATVGGEVYVDSVDGDFNSVMFYTDYNGNYFWSDSTDPVSVGVHAGETVTFEVGGMDPFTEITVNCHFAPAKEGTEFNPSNLVDAAKPYTFEVQLPEHVDSIDWEGNPCKNPVPVWITLNDVEGAILSIDDPNAALMGDIWADAEYDMDEDAETLKIQLSWLEDGAATIGIYSNDPEVRSYKVTISEPKGYDENPEVITDISKIEAETEGYNAPSYYYQWVATQSGKLTLTVDGVECNEEYLWAIEKAYDEETGLANAWYDVPGFVKILVNGTEIGNADPAVAIADVAKGDVVTIIVGSLVVPEIADWYDYALPAYVDVKGTLDPLGSETNPLRVNAATELAGIDVAAGGTTYIAINSQLNGQILTINADANTVVTLNGKELTAVNGVITAELTGTPVNALIVSNKGTADATYTAGINYAQGTAGNPISVTTEQGVAGKVEAGAEVHYLLNSKLSGAVLSVQGEGAYVIVDGVKTEAKDGIIKLTLDAKNPTISLVIGNTGSAAATVVLAHSDIPPTGDLSILAPAAALIVSAMSTVALVIKKKEF